MSATSRDAVTTYDAVVVGGGLAGLAAVHRLAHAGLHVALVEKRARLGGSSALSGGWFALSGTELQRRSGVTDSGAVFLDDMVRTGEGYADVSLLRTLVERQEHAITAIGRADAWTDELKVSAGMSVARAHLVHIGRILGTLRAEAVDAGATIRRGCAAEELLTDGARVVGVRCGAVELGADAGVILASGGFSRSRELLDLFVPAQAAAMPYGGVGNTGDGLHMAGMLGAGLADIGQVSGTYGQHPDATDDEHELLTANYLGAILVNARGERFADESASYKQLGAAVLAQPGRMAFQIFDATVRARSRPGVPLSDMERITELGHLVSAPSLEALEATLGLPEGSLRATVARYNGAVAAGTGDDFSRTGLVNGVGALEPITAAPFFAYAAVTAMTSTYGGLRVGVDGGVQRIDGSRIQGLYAAGEVVGGFHGASYMTGTALTKALVFGVEAADAIARS